MADFDFVVDTHPMAESVDDVSGHINGTTAAVVAMQAAVIAAESKAANKICENVDNGFYNLIRSQVSMKSAVNFTEMQAKLALLIDYRRTLERTQDRMESDFNRVKGLYRPIFTGLDKALSNRIAELDSAAVKIAETRKKVIMGMFERHVPEVAVTSAEVAISDREIAASRIKDKAGNSLKFLADKVEENRTYKGLMESMLDKSSLEAQQEEYIPVVYVSEQSTVMADTYVLTLHYPQYLGESIKNSINLNIVNRQETDMQGQKDDFERKSIADEFYALVSSSSVDQRVAENMMRLFQSGGC